MNPLGRHMDLRVRNPIVEEGGKDDYNQSQ